MRGTGRWLCVNAVGATLLGTGCASDTDAPSREPTITDPSTDEPTVDTPIDPCEGSLATWENVAEPFLTNWCTPCHSSSVMAADRQGAPDGIDFDRWELAAPWASQIRSAALVDAPRMPPAGGTSPEERLPVSEWVACGATGPATLQGPCDVLVTGVSDDPCTDGINAVSGDLLVDATTGRDFGCLCTVEGDLSTHGAEVNLDLLERVGGSLLPGTDLLSLRAPELLDIGGALALIDRPTLSLWSTPALEHVGGSVTLRGATGLEVFTLQRLNTVGAELVVEAAVGLRALNLERVEDVGGDYRVSGNPQLTSAPFWFDLERVGGSIVVTDNPGLTQLLLATYLTELGGGVEIGGNGLTFLAMLHDLSVVGGDVTVHDELALVSVAGMEDVTSIGGGLTFSNLPQVHALPTLAMVQSVGHVQLQDLGAVTAFTLPSLVQAGGGVSILRAPQLALLDLGHATIDGDLVLRSLGQLTTLSRLHVLDAVQGNLMVTDNPNLPAQEVYDLAFAVPVTGTVTAANNAP